MEAKRRKKTPQDINSIKKSSRKKKMVEKNNCKEDGNILTNSNENFKNVTTRPKRRSNKSMERNNKNIKQNRSTKKTSRIGKKNEKTNKDNNIEIKNRNTQKKIKTEPTKSSSSIKNDKKSDIHSNKSSSSTSNNRHKKLNDINNKSTSKSKSSSKKSKSKKLNNNDNKLNEKSNTHKKRSKSHHKSKKRRKHKWQRILNHKTSSQSKSLLSAVIEMSVCEFTPLTKNKLAQLIKEKEQEDSNITLITDDIQHLKTASFHESIYKTFWYGNFSGSNVDLESSSKEVSKQKIPLVRTLISYVPRVVVRRFIKNPTQPIIGPEVENYFACVLFADISGFTVLTESLTTLGPEGVERVSSHLNEYFTKMINLIIKYGGDIVKFAGDALIVIWPASSYEKGAYSMTLLGCQCALELQRKLGDFKVADDYELMLHIGIGAGNISGIHVGGAQGRLEFFVAGNPMDQVSSCESEANPGEIVISPQCKDIISKHFKGSLISENYKLEEIINPISLPQIKEFPLLEILETRLRSYVPDVVLSHLDTHEYLAELRTVTVLFVKLDILYHDDENSAKSIQLYFAGMQAILSRYEGTVRQFLIDDKGAVLIAAFGLPPLSHEDDPLRAVESAIQIKSFLSSMNVECGIGITTGRAFCGAVGSEKRREYAMVGDIVNLSARLMMASMTKKYILCDHATRIATRNQIQWEELERMTVKGKRFPIRVYVPEKPKWNKESSLEQKNSFQNSRMIGRENIIDQIGYILKRLDDQLDESGHTLIIEGEPGIGKTRLIHEIIEMAKEDQDLFIGTCDSVGDAQVYYGSWSFVFNSLLDLDSELLTTEEQVHEHIMLILKNIPNSLELPKGADDWRDVASLLNMILPLELPENSLVSKMTEQKKALYLKYLLLGILEIRIDPGSIIVLDDAHNFNLSSWTLTLEASQRLKGVLIVLSLRSMKTNKMAEYRQLLQGENSKHIVLTPLSSAESVELSRAILNVSKLPPQLEKQIISKGQGNPFIIEELTNSLKDSEMIEIHDDEVIIKKGAKLSLPSTVRQLITSKLDRLSTFEKSLLKIASVIGRVFDIGLLLHLLPGSPKRSDIEEGLNSLIKAGFIVPENDSQVDFQQQDDKKDRVSVGSTKLSKSSYPIRKIHDTDESEDKASSTNDTTEESQVTYSPRANYRGYMNITIRPKLKRVLTLNSPTTPRYKTLSKRLSTRSKATLRKISVGMSSDSVNNSSGDEEEEITEYSFRNQIIHEVVHTMMLFSQRRVLHANIVEYYEQKYSENLSQVSLLIAYHRNQSQSPAKKSIIVSESNSFHNIYGRYYIPSNLSSLFLYHSYNAYNMKDPFIVYDNDDDLGSNFQKIKRKTASDISDDSIDSEISKKKLKTKEEEDDETNCIIVNISDLLTLPQKEAANHLGISDSMLCKRFKASTKRKWPFKTI